MSYNVKFDKVNDNADKVETTFETKKPDLELNMTVSQVQNMGGSQRYGRGGRFLPDGSYVAINGHASRGGSPLKLKCTDGEIPISPTDFKNLKTLQIQGD